MGAGRPDRRSPEEAGTPAGRRFPASGRIRGSEEIRALFKRGKRKRTPHLDVLLAASPVSRPRIGIVVAKHGHGSVARNRLKRRLRELARTRVLPRLWASGCFMDILFRARREAYEASYGELEREVDGVMEEVC